VKYCYPKMFLATSLATLQYVDLSVAPKAF
jgi:hypothetical protein